MKRKEECVINEQDKITHYYYFVWDFGFLF